MREVEKFISVLWRVSKFLDNARIFKIVNSVEVLWEKMFWVKREMKLLGKKRELIKNN